MSNDTLSTISGKFYVGMKPDFLREEDQKKFRQIDSEHPGPDKILSFQEICTEIAIEEQNLINSEEYKTDDGRNRIDALIQAKHEEIKEFMKKHNIPVSNYIDLVDREDARKLIPQLKMGL